MFSHAIDETCRRLAGCERHNHRFTAPSNHFARSDHRGDRIVAAFHKHIGPQRHDQLQRRVFVENGDSIHARERRKHMGSLPRTAEGPRRPFEATHGVIAVNADDQRIAAIPRSTQEIDVSGVQQVKDTIRKDQAAWEASPPGERLIARQNFARWVQWVQERRRGFTLIKTCFQRSA